MKSTPIVLAAAQMKYRSNLPENVVWICQVIEASANQGVTSILFPECAVTGYNCDFAALSQSQVRTALSTISQAARRARCNVLVGCPTWNGRRRFNSLVVLNRQGREVFCYSKIHLTEMDKRFFSPGNSLAYFHLDGIPCTAIICHERRFPELVRIPVMLGAKIVFHPNAGLDSLAVSKCKRGGRDGISVRAFENDIYYVFANTAGAQGNGFWSAGDSKIVAPNSSVLALANHRDETVIHAAVDLALARRKYAREALQQPVFLREQWRKLLTICRRELERTRS